MQARHRKGESETLALLKEEELNERMAGHCSTLQGYFLPLLKGHGYGGGGGDKHRS